MKCIRYQGTELTVDTAASHKCNLMRIDLHLFEYGLLCCVWEKCIHLVSAEIGWCVQLTEVYEIYLLISYAHDVIIRSKMTDLVRIWMGHAHVILFQSRTGGAKKRTGGEMTV